MTGDPACTTWRIRPEHPLTGELQAELGCSRVLANLLLHRGVGSSAEARRFLTPDFSDLADPALLPDAEQAIRRLLVALDRHQPIYVYGDYDCDGITAAALWARLLELLGAEVHVHVPHRRRDGYDLRDKVVEAAKALGAKLILTADCGTQRYQEVEAAREAGIDVIVTDHHEVGRILPRAAAVVNPLRRDSRYPFRYLAGVGVAYRLGEALVARIGLPVEKYRAAFSELAAIGTIADIMPLLEDNRVFVKVGLDRMQETRRKGLRALLRATRLHEKPITSTDVGYVIGPRLNAVGRVDEPRKALDLLLTREEETADELAAELEAANQSRRQQEQDILAEALEQVSRLNMDKQPGIVLDAENWHPGVIGIVANRLVDRLCRPCVLISHDTSTGIARGSGRSIPSFNLHAALDACADYLLEYGGHAHAAGFTIPSEAVEDFRQAFLAIAASKIAPEDLQPVLLVDALLSVDDITLDLVRELQTLEPWGHDNEEPLFASLGVRVCGLRVIGRDRTHLKLWVADKCERAVEAVLWNGGSWAEILHPGARIDICYRARINVFNGTEAPQLQLQALRPFRTR